MANCNHPDLQFLMEEVVPYYYCNDCQQLLARVLGSYEPVRAIVDGAGKVIALHFEISKERANVAEKVVAVSR